LAGGLLPPEGVAFDDRTLLYDVFRSADDRHAYLLGPPAIGVEAWFHTLIERSVAATTPVGWFQNDRHMRGWVTGQLDRIDVSDEHLVPQSLVVQPNLSHLFEGRRVAFTLQKDNNLDWVADWANFYATCHGADAVLIYDNGSTRYTPERLHRIVSAIPGISQAVVVPWTYPFGVTGSTNFCHAIMLEHARRRFLASARSVINADIDELAVFDRDVSVFETVEDSETGYIQAPGLYIANATYAAPDRRRHRDFEQLVPGAPPSPPKWAAVPSRCPDASVWRPHFIAGLESSAAPDDLRFRHFKAINTGWLEPRWQPGETPSSDADIDQAWHRQAAKVAWTDHEESD
jgi:hypothetical protein